MNFQVLVATSEHVKYAEEICEVIEASAAARGTGIAKRSPEYIKNKMIEVNTTLKFEDKELNEKRS